MVECVVISKRVSSRLVETLKGRHPDERHYSSVIGERDADVYWPDGTLLLSYRKGVVPATLRNLSRKSLEVMAKPTNKRPIAAGENAVFHNNFAGFYEGKPAAFNSGHPAHWRHVLPLLRLLDLTFRETRPNEYATLAAAAGSISTGRLIPDTSFTTVTANLCATGIHQDPNNLDGGLGALTAMRSDGFVGGLLVFPAADLAVDLYPGDVLIADNREYHGNTRFLSGSRATAVAYFNASNLRY